MRLSSQRLRGSLTHPALSNAINMWGCDYRHGCQKNYANQSTFAPLACSLKVLVGSHMHALWKPFWEGGIAVGAFGWRCQLRASVTSPPCEMRCSSCDFPQFHALYAVKCHKMKVKLVLNKRTWKQPQRNIVLMNYTRKKNYREHAAKKQTWNWELDWLPKFPKRAFPQHIFRNYYLQRAIFMHNTSPRLFSRMLT